MAGTASVERGRFLYTLSQHSDIALAVAVVGILVTLIIPLPTFLLDVLLTVNIAFSLAVLMMVLNARTPLEFSTFPALLLCATLFRLSLNVASTRLILLNGNAGQVIRAFGNFVVGGNLVVGLVVFLILVVIQFVVITKGAGRISEVAARFTLDAMPGKQMAIDADLNAGLITEDQARERRALVGREMEFYGAMDGASKFVRGDAIAGIVITVVNLVGGIVMGLLRHLSVGEAVHTYSILTVGDGLVTQIPSLIVATAAGILITKNSSDTSLGKDLAGQLLSQPRALLLAAGMLAFFGLIPGLPTVPFFVLAALFTTLYVLCRSSRPAGSSIVSQVSAQPEAAPEVAPTEQSARQVTVPPVDRLSVEVGYQLVPLVDPNKAGGLLDRISGLRRQFARRLGFVVPPIRFKDNVQLDAHAYVIRVKGEAVAEGTILPDRFLAIDAGAGREPIEGITVKEPAFGLPAVWIEERHKNAAELAGYTVIDPISVLVTHLSETVKRHAHEILSRDDVQTLIDHLKETAPAVVNELIPNLMTVGAVQKVLRRLLREGVPITDLSTILEALADFAPNCKDVELLTEHVRQALARTICSQHQGGDGKLHALSLDPAFERELAQTLRQAEQQTGRPALEPHLAQRFFEELPAALERAMSAGHDVVLLTSSAVRRHVRALTERMLPNLPVLSYEELAPGVQVQVQGIVSVPVVQHEG